MYISERPYNSNSLRFDVAFWKLMNKCQTVPGEEGIVLSGYIMGDGVGDFAHLEKEARLLSKKFPQRRITSIAVAAEKHRGKLNPKQLNNVSYHVAYSGRYGSPSRDQPPFQEADLQSLLQTIKEAAVWLSGPIAINNIFDSLGKESKEKGFAINEYGFGGNLRGDDFLYNIRMGLGNNEIGIYTNNIKDDYKWDTVENSTLKEFLFHTQDVQASHVESYLVEYEPFMCYLSNDSNAISFIYRALFFASYHNDRKKIDIIYPAKTDLRELREHLIKHFNMPLTSLTINDEKIFENNKSDEFGFHLRIFNPGKLSKKDFKKVMYLCSPFVGCTGNTSIGQALSYEKIPFYEQLAQTKGTKASLQRIAGRVSGQDSLLAEFLDTERNVRWYPSEKEWHILKDDRLLADAKQLSTAIKQEYSLNDALPGMVNAHLCRHKYPEFAAAIDSIREQFLNQQIDLVTAGVQIKSELNNLGLLTSQE